jgi:peptide/nickel transport system permease protein
VGLSVIAAFAPWLAPYGPYDTDLLARNAPPSWYSQWYEEHPNIPGHPLGADYVGRDVMSRIFHGARISMMISLIAIVTGMTIGSVLGLVGGFYGGWVDELTTRLVDIWLSMPFILVAMVVTIVLGSSLGVIMGVLALLAWSVFVRNVRADVLTLKTRDYVALARVAGASDTRIIIRHIVPGTINTIVVLATLRVGQLIMAEATLSFLGAGIPSPIPAWGLMVSEGRDYISTAWWTALFPGVFIFLLAMSLNFIGDWFRDRIDPRLAQL